MDLRIGSKEKPWLCSLWSKPASREDRRDWRPRSLTTTFLLFIIVMSALLIALLQTLLVISQRDNGLIFAEDVTKLPLSRSFAYLYLPTIIAVIYGFAWTWIDLDVRRMEPFYQLAKEGGASAEQSMLLSYPVDFVASVPLKALRYRHWSPFVASFATVFVFWGLTPSQAGIFASSTVNRTTTISMAYSTSHLSLAQQAGSLSSKSANSVSSILWLNETLQPYMTRNAALAPFGPLGTSVSSEKGLWTGDTWQYFANVSCEPAIVYKNGDSYWLNSTWGCSTTAPSLRSRAVSNQSEAKVFDTLYVGYYNLDGNADYYLSNSRCPKNASNSFMVQWSMALVDPLQFFNMSPSEQRDNAQVTTMYCRSAYSAQKVRATIELPTRMVIDVQELASAEGLSPDLFNSSAFEADMSEGRDRTRTEFPSLEWPDQTSYLTESGLFLGFLSRMAPFAIGSTKLPMTDYLKPDKLESSYRGAYQLLFARQMVDVMLPQMDETTATNGTITLGTQAIIVVPTFAYIVEGLLGAACIFAAAILFLSRQRPTKLKADPASIKALMSLVADDEELLRITSRLDTSTTEELGCALRKHTFELGRAHGGENGDRIIISPKKEGDLGHTLDEDYNSLKTQKAYSDSETYLPGIQPMELSLKIGAAFVLSLLTVFIVLGYLYIQTQKTNGLALPSSNRFIRQLLENYIPTGVATLIEPFWLLLNRNICYLQPFETMRQRSEISRRSIDLDYVSLPPQLVVIKALLGRHILLAVVCLMTLLANVLSVSMSGLFFEATVEHPLPTTFLQNTTISFKPLLGNASALTTYAGDLAGPFYVATSNETASTPLPPWTDAKYFYQPFNASTNIAGSETSLRSKTGIVGATLVCEPLSSDSFFNVTGTAFDESGVANILSHSDLRVQLVKDGNSVACVPRNQILNGLYVDPQTLSSKARGNCAFEFAYGLQSVNGSSSQDDDFCREHLATGWVRGRLIDGVKTPGTEKFDTTPSDLVSFSSAIMVCRSSIETGSANVKVSKDGHVIFSDNVESQSASNTMFASNAADIIGHAHESILRTSREWHNDTNPSDFGNYLIMLSTNSSALLDPNAEMPSFETVTAAFTNTYSKLFAIWLQQNRAQLFESERIPRLVEGTLLEPQIRIFMSKTMFILSECILALYVLSAVMLYVQRPWKVLCRLPTTLASVTAYFAASRAVHDMKRTQRLSGEERLERSTVKYGFGSFIGLDQCAHVGIEKQPFVVPLTRGDVPSSTSQGIDEHNNLTIGIRLRLWRSGKAKEGGWL